MKKSDFPALDVFICTADPYKEPPMRLVNTALSVMAYDYPTEKISAYISDDGGSQLTLFACMEAAKFASHWLPFCRKNNIVDRSPEAYFASNHYWCSDAEKIKVTILSAKLRYNFFIYLFFFNFFESSTSSFSNKFSSSFSNKFNYITVFINVAQTMLYSLKDN
jgi:hypothetical protein